MTLLVRRSVGGILGKVDEAQRKSLYILIPKLVHRFQRRNSMVSTYVEVVMVLLLLAAPSQGSPEFPIATEQHSQVNPAIYGHIVVWEDERNGNKDIYGYDIETAEEFQITTDTSDQENPAMYGRVVVWEDRRQGNADIYGYNLDSHQEFQITTDPKDQTAPEIYENIVVWQDDRNGNSDIYGYNLETHEEFQVTTDEGDQYFPTVYGEIVVWEDCRNGNKDIYGYNMTTREEFQIAHEDRDERFPVIYQDVVIWNTYPEVHPGGACTLPGTVLGKDILILSNNPSDHGISGYNLSTGNLFRITKNGVSSSSALSGTLVVWTDMRDIDNPYSPTIDSDIYGYDLTSRKEIRITTDLDRQAYPAVYNTTVVWVDYRGDSPDIYGCILTDLPESYTLPFLGVLAVVLIVVGILIAISGLRKAPEYEPFQEMANS
jgi:TolB protein